MALTRFQTAIVVAPNEKNAFTTEMLRPHRPVNVPTDATIRITKNCQWGGAESHNIESITFNIFGSIVVKMKTGAEARFVPIPTFEDAVLSKKFLYFRFHADGSIDMRDRETLKMSFGPELQLSNWTVKRYEIYNFVTKKWESRKG